MAAGTYRPRKITAQTIRAVAKLNPPERPREIRDKQSGLILRHQPSGYLGLYADLGRGKRERICNARDITDESNTLTMGRAKQRARILRGESAGGRDFAQERAAARRVPTLSEYLNDSRDDNYGWHLVHDPKHKTGNATLARLKSCFEKDFGRKKISNITPDLLDAWTARRRRDVTAETVNRDVAALKAALNRAVEWNKIPQSPLRGYKPLTVDRAKRTQRPMTEDEITKLRAALEAREERIRRERKSGNEHRAQRGYELLPSLEGQYVDNLLPAVELSLATGMRRGELLALRWENLDLKRQMIHLEGEDTKSSQSRDIPLNDYITGILRKWNMQHGRPAKGYIFAGGDTHVVNLKKSYHAVLEAAGIARVTKQGRMTWHSLRHTFGTRLGAAGVDPQTLRELMGHADLTTTQRYLQSDDERRRKAVAALV